MTQETMTAAEFKALRPQTKRRKYGNRPTVLDGRHFDSGHEAARYAALVILQRCVKIRDLECQPRYAFEVNGVLVGYYTADFRYVDCETGERVIEDAKSEATKRETAYRLRKKLMLACFGVEVREV